MYSTAFVPVRGKPVVKERAVGDPDRAVHSLYLSFCCIANAGCKHKVLRIYYYVLMAWSLPVWLAQYEKCIQSWVVDEVRLSVAPTSCGLSVCLVKRADCRDKGRFST